MSFDEAEGECHKSPGMQACLWVVLDFAQRR